MSDLEIRVIAPNDLIEHAIGRFDQIQITRRRTYPSDHDPGKTLVYLDGELPTLRPPLEAARSELAEAGGRINNAANLLDLAGYGGIWDTELHDLFNQLGEVAAEVRARLERERTEGGEAGA